MSSYVQNVVGCGLIINEVTICHGHAADAQIRGVITKFSA